MRFFKKLKGLDSAEGRTAWLWVLSLAALFSLVAGMGWFDIVTDLHDGAPVHAVVAEVLVLVVGLLGLTLVTARFLALVRRARILAQRAEDLEARLNDSRREAEQWRNEAGDLIAGFAAAIDRQLERWALSPAEKEVALLLLKGLSHKDVANVRAVGEATVRQQARAIYRKAGLTGRNDLAAFFLEDLLGPRQTASSTTVVPRIPENSVRDAS
jgi:DNA-binding CsgD family transcriptional regulator